MYLEKDTFDEDENIYYMLKLTNTNEQSVWVSPFTLRGTVFGEGDPEHSSSRHGFA
jgi:hypothetical protein